MGFRNNATGYPADILQSRSIIVKDNYALITPDGLVRNRIPGFTNCEVTILSSPKLGASFVDYLVTMLPGAKNTAGFGGDGVETFVFVLDGSVTASDGEQDFELGRHGYLFVPASRKLTLANTAEGSSELFLYKRRYLPLEGHTPYTVCGNTDKIASYDYEGMADVQLTDLLPIDDLAFDMNFHILAFEPGASHGYVETHVQEHGALILSGEGLYNLDNEWIPVREGDYIFMAAYCPQAGYGIGRKGAFTYLYSKDCNRDENI
ncbi:MAG: (S)-ureidoglycine aminohydrolase [Coriobacteriales bacterium]|jgi:(S)-ureidoglycine aminohydrolase|nr:(S)-ureidoglycine aminohydrolase [Coriobacteriales bacterium]